MIGFPVDPNGYYHALWCWTLDAIEVAAVVWREGDGAAAEWHLDTFAAGLRAGDRAARFSAPGPQSAAELDGLLRALYDCARLAAHGSGVPVSPAVRLPLRCSGREVPARLAALRAVTGTAQAATTETTTAPGLVSAGREVLH